MKGFVRLMRTRALIFTNYSRVCEDRKSHQTEVFRAILSVCCLNILCTLNFRLNDCRASVANADLGSDEMDILKSLF